MVNTVLPNALKYLYTTLDHNVDYMYKKTTLPEKNSFKKYTQKIRISEAIEKLKEEIERDYPDYYQKERKNFYKRYFAHGDILMMIDLDTGKRKKIKFQHFSIPDYSHAIMLTYKPIVSETGSIEISGSRSVENCLHAINLAGNMTKIFILLEPAEGWLKRVNINSATRKQQAFLNHFTFGNFHNNSTSSRPLTKAQFN